MHGPWGCSSDLVRLLEHCTCVAVSSGQQDRELLDGPEASLSRTMLQLLLKKYRPCIGIVARCKTYFQGPQAVASVQQSALLFRNVCCHEEMVARTESNACMAQLLCGLPCRPEEEHCRIVRIQGARRHCGIALPGESHCSRTTTSAPNVQADWHNHCSPVLHK